MFQCPPFHARMCWAEIPLAEQEPLRHSSSEVQKIQVHEYSCVNNSINRSLVTVKHHRTSAFVFPHCLVLVNKSLSDILMLRFGPRCVIFCRRQQGFVSLRLNPTSLSKNRSPPPSNATFSAKPHNNQPLRPRRTIVFRSPTPPNAVSCSLQ